MKLLAIILISLIGINAYLFFAIEKYSANRYRNRVLKRLKWWDNICKPCVMFWLCGFEVAIVSIVMVNPLVLLASFPLAVLGMIGLTFINDWK